MEDAIICQPSIIPNIHLFGVLDGHGGSEVSAIVSKKFPEVLSNNARFK